MPDRRSQMERLAGYFLGHGATHWVQLGVESGLFAALAARPEGADAATLAQDLGMEAGRLEHVLRAGFALELLERDAPSGSYRLAPYMDSLLADPESSSYLGALARLQLVASRDFERMRSLLETGEIHSFQEHDDDFIHSVAHSTAGIARFVAGRVLPSLPGLEGRDDLRVLDLGCGAGENLVALARALPRGRLVGVDIEPRSVGRANQRLRDEGLAERAQARLAPAEAIEERSDFDMVTLIQVLHETREDARPEILARAHAALRPGGLLLLVDEPYPEDPQQLRDAPWTALQQLVEIFWGNVFLSPEAQQRMLGEAGFEIASHATLPPGLICVTLARKPARAEGS